MASKAWYKPTAVPQLIARFDSPSSPSKNAGRKAVEVWTTTCIVANFGMSRDAEGPARRPRCSTLVNPANPNLSGPHSFPYFPRGGPQPPLQPNRHAHHIMGYVSQWGGMDVGNGMLFPAETIDGLVHQMGGLRLRAECSLLPPDARAHVNRQATEPVIANDDDGAAAREPRAEGGATKCPVGAAVATSPGGEELRRHYDRVIHTAPPFYEHPPRETRGLKRALGIAGGDAPDSRSWSRELLRSCYRRSFDLAFETRDARPEGTGNLLRDALDLFGFGTPSTRRISGSNNRVAVPLLGAGCRAFPKDVALDVAAFEGASWLSKLDSKSIQESKARGNDADSDRSMSVVFGLLEKADAEALSERLERLLINSM